MTDFSPYAPPRAELVHSSDEGIWQQGKLVVVRHDVHFPDRCIKCNAPASQSSKTPLYWHTPVLYLLVLISLPLYAIIAYFVRKKATVHVGLCPRHYQRMIIGRVLAWGSLVTIVGGITLIAGKDGPAFGAGLLLVSLLMIIFAMVFSRRLVATRIDDKLVYAKGCNPAFLQTLPALPPQP